MILAILLIIVICSIPSVIVYYILNRRLTVKGNRYAAVISILAFIITFCIAVVVFYLVAIGLEYGRGQ